MDNGEKDASTQKDNMGYAIAIGAGLGLVLGELVFRDVGLGLVFGTLLGIAYNRVTKGKNDSSK